MLPPLLHPLRSHQRTVYQTSQPMRRAGVALVFHRRPDDGALSLLLIRRAEREGDRWSGQIAFPGGKQDPEDPDVVATARREAAEEVGIRLAQPFGVGDDLPARPSGAVPLVVTPVFWFLPELPPLVHNEAEVAESMAVPLADLGDDRFRSEMSWQHRGQDITLPAVRWGGHTIWGLTLYMIDSTRRLLGAHGV